MKICFLLNSAPGMAALFSLMNNIAQQNGLETCAISNSRLVDLKYKSDFVNCKYYSTLDDMVLDKEITIPFDLWRKWYPSLERKSIFGPLDIDYREAVEIASRIYRNSYTILSNEMPDIVIYEPPSNVFSLIIYAICQELNIKYFGLIGSRIPGKFDIFDRGFTSRLLEENSLNNSLNDVEAEKIKRLINGIVDHTLLPSYVIEVSKQENIVSYYLKRLIEESKVLFKWCLLKKEDRVRDYEAKFFLHNILKNILKRFKSKYMLEKTLETTIPTEPYFVLPLHVQPEASTSAQATYYSDLYNFIRNCAISIPFPYKLVVKEHPAFSKLREKSFYKKINKIPNVVVLHAGVNNQELIKNSEGVITLTSTIGFESLLIQKPIYIFGDVFFDCHSAATKIDSWDNLYLCINNGASLTPEEWEKLNIDFMQKYLNINYEGSFIYTNKICHTRENAKLLIESILSNYRNLVD